MIPFNEAYDIVQQSVRPMPAESVPLQAACGRILAQDIRTDVAMPPFDRVMVDGYACRRADLGEPMTVLETVGAGHAPTRAIEPGTCSNIMTGAVKPEGADCVFMVEHSREEEDGRVRFIGDTTNDNISPYGKHMVPGDTLLTAGHAIRPPDIAVLATTGSTTVDVARQPRVGIIATGDELVEPECTPDATQIRNSNAYQLCAQVETAGCVANYVGIAMDNTESLHEHISRGLRENDVLLLSGGVSMGEFDLVPGVLKENGVRIQFDRVAIQPGKPTTFGVTDTETCFGLPGNPVATYTIFELVVKPYLYALMGHDYAPLDVRLPLGEPFTRKSGGREAWVPAVIRPGGTIGKVDYHGSAHINALCHAHGLIAFPQGVTTLEEGRVMAIRLTR